MNKEIRSYTEIELSSFNPMEMLIMTIKSKFSKEYLNKIFFKFYDADYWWNKTMYLQSIIERSEILDLIEEHVKVETFDSQAIKKTCQFDIHMTSFHSMEALFSTIFAFIFKPENPWIYLTEYKSGQLNSNIKKIANKEFDLANSTLGKIIFGLAFEKFNKLLPVEKILETDKAIAFYHPKPSYNIHIVIVPKKAICSLTEAEKADLPFLSECVKLAGRIAKELKLDKTSYKLILNGGKNQKVGQVHFHLINREK